MLLSCFVPQGTRKLIFVLNMYFISQDTSARVDDHIPLPDTEKFSNVQIKSDEHFSVIPKTLGTRRKPFDEVCTE